MSAIATASTLPNPGPSPFAGQDVCRWAGLRVRAGGTRPRFEDERWDFNDVEGLAEYLLPGEKTMAFEVIRNPAWRIVAKEYAFARMTPTHPAVAPLPHAHRTALGVVSAAKMVQTLGQWFTWLEAEGLFGLGEVDQEMCDRYLAYREFKYDADGRQTGPLGDDRRRVHVSAVTELSFYSELLSTDRYREGFMPWRGASPRLVVGSAWTGANSTPEVADRVHRPMLAAALYVVGTIGPHLIELRKSLRESDALRAAGGVGKHERLRRLERTLERYRAVRSPLPRHPPAKITQRLNEGWNPSDPLLEVGTGVLAKESGFKQFYEKWLDDPAVRATLEQAVAELGILNPYARDAPPVARADGGGDTLWTLPLTGYDIYQLTTVVRTAAALVVAAVAGMRSSEIMELEVGCPLQPEQIRPGMLRYRIAGLLVKGQPPGGMRDEWVVIKQVWEALGIAQQLVDETPGRPLIFGRFSFPQWYPRFRTWVNSAAGARLGLEPIPETEDDHVTLRMLRRTLALELAYRPSGLLASKIALKHVSAATTEGYAARPGGSQSQFLDEVSEFEAEHHLDLVFEAYEDYAQGVRPAGPGARDLIGIFESVDKALVGLDRTDPRVYRTNREVLNLMRAQAATLHPGVANYCWFKDPAKAVCLLLAGTPTADKPLAGMCDSARCPQATHHPCHRPVWASHEKHQVTFIGNLGTLAKSEKSRQEAELRRTRRILAEIDAAAGGKDV